MENITPQKIVFSTINMIAVWKIHDFFILRMLRFVLSILFLSLVWFRIGWLDLNHQNLRLGFCEKDILSILSYILSQEKLTHKKCWAILKNFNLSMIKLQNWCFGQFYHLGIEVLQNFVSVSLVRRKFEGMREFIFQKIRT